MAVPFRDYEILKSVKNKIDNTEYLRPSENIQRRKTKPKDIGFYRYLDDNTIYYGSFKNGKKDGYGIIIHTDEIIYEGEFVDDHTLGTGIFLFEDESYYIGEVNAHGPNGTGTYYGAKIVDDDLMSYTE